MFLSRLKLNPVSRSTRELLLKPYLFHQAIYHAFPDSTDERILYRIDQDRLGYLNLIVQSDIEPDWSKAEYLQNCLLEPAEYKLFTPTFSEGQMLTFRLRANPTKRLGKSAVENKGKRIGIFHEDEQIKWLKRKGESGGFTVINCRTSSEGIVHNEVGKDEGKLRHYAVLFNGVLSVTDAELFRQTVKNGVGSAKGFGFGLLSLAPVRK